MKSHFVEILKKKNENIDKYGHDRLPEPEIPADEAWVQMDGLLGPGVTPVKAPGTIAKLLKMKWALLSVGAAGVISAVVILTNIKNASDPDRSQKKGLASRQEIVITEDRTANGVIDSMKSKMEEKPGQTLVEKTDTAYKSAPLNATGTNAADHGPANARRRNLFSRKSTNTNSPAKLRKENWKTVDATSQIGDRNVVNGGNRARRAQETDRANQPGQDTGHTLADRSAQSINAAGQGDLLNNTRVQAQSSGSGIASENTTDERTAGRKSVAQTLQLLKPVSILKNDKQPDIPEIQRQKSDKKPDKPRPELADGFQIGPEWGIGSSLANTDYIFAGKDSVAKPLLALIPGIFVSKSWQRHLVSFTFSPYHSYFGNRKMLAHAVDSTLSTDSVKSYNNVRLLKASGLNFSIYYHYRATKFLALGAGASYSIFTNALVRNEFENWQGKILPQELETLTRSNRLSETMNPRLFALKAGILFNPGRLQLGLNMIAPVTSVSRVDKRPFKTLNGQLFLRFNCF